MVQLTLWKIFKDNIFTRLPQVSSFEKDLTDKTVILTGATAGVGLEIAKHLARVSPKKMILGCRSLERGNQVVQMLVSLGYTGQVEVWHLDLADFKTIISFVNRFEETEAELDLLIQCAGTWFGKYENTIDGWEMNMQSNFLGPALLVLLLLPSLRKAKLEDITPRIIIVGSEGHCYVHGLSESKAPNILKKLNEEEYCISKGSLIGERYYVSKLFILFFTRELSTYLNSLTPPLTITCVTPGFTSTSIFRYDHSMLRGRSFNIIKRILARSPEYGSRPIMWAVYTTPRDDIHGKWCSSCQVEEEGDFAISKEGNEIQKKIWREMLDILVEVDHKVALIEKEYLTKEERA